MRAAVGRANAGPSAPGSDGLAAGGSLRGEGGGVERGENKGAGAEGEAGQEAANMSDGDVTLVKRGGRSAGACKEGARGVPQRD